MSIYINNMMSRVKFDVVGFLESNIINKNLIILNRNIIIDYKKEYLKFNCISKTYKICDIRITFNALSCYNLEITSNKTIMKITNIWNLKEKELLKFLESELSYNNYNEKEYFELINESMKQK